MENYKELACRIKKRYKANETGSTFVTLCSRRDVIKAATAITELLARAEKAEMERDEAVEAIEWLVNENDCPTYVCREICANHDGVCSERAKLGFYDTCKGFKFRKTEE